MLKPQNMQVLQNKKIAQDTFELKLTGPQVQDMTQPGQFLHVMIGEGWEHVLRRPLSITDVEHHVVTVIYKIVGKGTRALTEKKQGDSVDVLGPRGNGFPYQTNEDQHILLVGGGVGVPPLYYLAKKLVAQGNKVTTVLGFQTYSAVFYEKEFQGLGDLFITTDDGSYGHKGIVTDVFERIEKPFDLYYTCGPKPMIKAVTNELMIPGFMSLEERMGCGIGACFACVCEAADTHDEKGYRKVCQDGPVFPVEEVML
ncbi:dihydroorotate dehydrogenase electron transfer subunit [Pontibacillus sp. HMF3514]|uniref:dihydroorotate dehydrogenase electron transfer subunit n=1 Tax=Pontibacillus sp. HMF3514 TaxID=2692425 RepID=UPI00132000FC|nr:dihydroorotate dehydrogenase electron transfer subunit [Pontibacillus sp. HMF3514]QHE52129.1 dihydroorotate dehydrogenase electron transfer subunit [Pontibacillus sp. HMF3514]